MTTATTAPKTRARAAAPTTAVVPATLTHEEIMALLAGQGAVAQPSNEYHRMKLENGILVTDDGEMFPPRKDAPAVRLRIVSPPKYYNAIFLSDKGDDPKAFDARQIGRGDLNGRFTRRYDDPAHQAEDNNPANEVYDLVAEKSGQRGQFKADLEVQIVPESGEMTGEETVYTLAISTTSIFEWRGSSRDQVGGMVSEKNTMVELAELAVANAAEWGVEPAQAVVNALISLKLGGVVCDTYILRAQNDAKTQTWSVLHFTPVHIEPADGGAPALTSGGDVPI